MYLRFHLIDFISSFTHFLRICNVVRKFILKCLAVKLGSVYSHISSHFSLSTFIVYLGNYVNLLLVYLVFYELWDIVWYYLALK